MASLPAVVFSQTWDGGGTNDLWSSSTNWSTDAVPVNSATNNLHFGGSTRLNNTNDLVGLTLSNLFFDTGASSFILNGNLLNVNGSIENNSANNQTINNDITFQAPGTIHAAAGNLIFNGIINNGGFNLTVDGSFNTDINKLLSGAGGLTKNGSGTLTLGASNSYSGSTLVNNGTLITSHSNAFRGTPTLTVQNGSKLLNTTTDSSGAGFFHNTAANRSALITGAGSLWSNAGALAVGNNAGLNNLVVSNGGTVVNSIGIIGRLAPSANNRVTIDGAGSLWSNLQSLSVGGVGGTNNLSIRNGGVVYAASVYVGSNSAFNTINISDAGSRLLITNNLFVGRGSAGRNNGIIISNGGYMANVSSFIGNHNNASSNGVIVTGAGSTWSNGNRLAIGSDNLLSGGDFNYLIISNGGRVINVDAEIGADNNASNNYAIVTGSGSSWSNSGHLIVGQDGVNNRLIVNQGAHVYVGDNLQIGESGGFADNNSAAIADSGTRVDVGGNIRLGFSYNSLNTLSVSNGAQMFANDSLIIGSGADNTLSFGTSVLNRVIVENAGSSISVSNSVTVGSGGACFNSLIIRDGAQVNSESLNIGVSSPGLDNYVFVDGTGSAFNVTANIDIGQSDGLSFLSISNGGHVVSTDATLGIGSGSYSNRVIVSGSFSVWSNHNDIIVGDSGYKNELVIQNSGTVWAANITLGQNNASSNNALKMLDSTLTVTDTLNVARGFVVINGNDVSIGTLIMNTTNTSTFTFNRGDLLTQNASISNNLPFIIGDGNGIQNAVYTLGNQGAVNGHTFNNGLLINTNNLLISQTSERMNDTTDLTLLQSSRWNLGGNTETIRNLTFNGAELDASAGAALNVTSGFITNEIGGATIEMTGGTLTIGAAIVGQGALTKTGIGGLILDADNTYTGFTTIVGGTFTVNGTISPSVNGVTLQSGTTLSGTGTIDRAVTMESDSTLSPGNSTGILTVEKLTLENDTIYRYEKGATVFDRTDVLTDLVFASSPTITLQIVDVGGAVFFGTNVLMRYGTQTGYATTTFTVDTSLAPTAAGGYVQNNTVLNQIEYVLIPEPSTLALLALSCLFLKASRRNKTHNPAKKCVTLRTPFSPNSRTRNE